MSLEDRSRTATSWPRGRFEKRLISRSEDYYDNIVFSWFGFYAAEVSAYFFAHVKTRLEEDELVERATRAPSAFEIDNIDWYSLDHPTISNVLATWIDGPWRPQHDELGRKLRSAHHHVAHSVVAHKPAGNAVKRCLFLS